jgi:hypothetical protein
LNSKFPETIEIGFDPEEDMKVTLVVARYYTGDTFGTTNGNWRVIAVVKTTEEALKVQEAIKKSVKSDCYEIKVPEVFLNHSTCDWNGYFEGLEDVELHRMEIQE